jgi:DNA-binding NarL/FixJ family response regulator
VTSWPDRRPLVSDEAGGVGYLLKDRIRDLDDFTDAIRRIAKGGSVIDPAVVAVLVGRRSRVPLDDRPRASARSWL